MADILRVTQPVSGYDNTVKNPSSPTLAQQGNVTNAVNPDRVVKTDNKHDYSQDSFLLASNSNFTEFIKNLTAGATPMETLSRLFMNATAMKVSSGMGENFAQDISKFLDMVSVESEGELAAMLKDQFGAENSYTGPLFQAFFQILGKTGSVELKSGILDFVRTANDMLSSDHVFQNMETLLGKIEDYMFPRDAKELAKLTEGLQQGQTKENLNLMKQDVIPLLHRYITKTNDFGKIRNMITLLTLNLSRYENGSEDKVLQSLKKLLNFNELHDRLGDVSADRLLAALKRDGQTNPAWMEKFTGMLEESLKGSYGAENRSVFLNMMQSMLMNQSVYMPLMHVMLPINYQDRMMFSEMWIDPDDSNDQNGQNSQGKERKIKGLIKFDIQGVGFFDLVFRYGADSMFIDLSYPEKLKGSKKEIQKALEDILQNNGLKADGIQLGTREKPLEITEVFPKIYERKNSINVRV